MRMTVLVLDGVIFFPAAWWLSKRLGGGQASVACRFGLVLMQPALLLIDHGHFQYNSVSLGLALGAAAALCEGRDLLASLLFSLSLNFKQMSLYYAPVFFVVLLVRCARGPRPWVTHLAAVGGTVAATFAALWLPFCAWAAEGSSCAESLGQIVSRLFPFGRGLFEDKVANVWYESGPPSLSPPRGPLLAHGLSSERA